MMLIISIFRYVSYVLKVDTCQLGLTCYNEPFRYHFRNISNLIFGLDTASVTCFERFVVIKSSVF